MSTARFERLIFFVKNFDESFEKAMDLVLREFKERVTFYAKGKKKILLQVKHI